MGKADGSAITESRGTGTKHPHNTWRWCGYAEVRTHSVKKTSPLLLTSVPLPCNLSERVWAAAEVTGRRAGLSLPARCVSGLAIYHKCQRGALTHLAGEENFTELFCQSWRGSASILDSCCPGEKGSGRGLWLPVLAPILPASLLPKGRSTPRTQPLTAHGDLRHQNATGLFRALLALVTGLKRAERKPCVPE